jgi:predicted TIM-barrel fold metal-dependent hydrolase
MGRPDIESDADLRVFHRILDLLRSEDLWVKLTAYRNSRTFPEMSDVRFLHDKLVVANSERLLWGSDWPHVNINVNQMGKVDTKFLFEEFLRWMGNDEILIKQILVKNASKLYEFD